MFGPAAAEPFLAMAGTLYLVATPIGNLEDITLRALRLLGEVDLIAAEDTRRTSILLRHHGISTRTTSLHAHNERRKTLELLAKLLKGDSVALVSDAGTPLVSDPGLELVQAAQDAGVAVVPVPGASAPIAALIASGAPTASFRFVGFPPRKLSARRSWCRSLIAAGDTTVFFEAPHRLDTTLRLLRDVIPERRIALCRELTKIHEELVVRPICVVLEGLARPRGEYTCVVWPADQPVEPPQSRPTAVELAAEMLVLADAHGARRLALKELAQKYGMSRRELYGIVESTKQ